MGHVWTSLRVQLRLEIDTSVAIQLYNFCSALISYPGIRAEKVDS